MPKEYTTHDGWKRACKSLCDKLGFEGHSHITGATKKDLREYLIAPVPIEGLAAKEFAKEGVAVIGEWDGEKGTLDFETTKIVNRVKNFKKPIAKAPWLKPELVWRWDINKGTAHHCFGAAETFEHAAMSAVTGGSGEPGDLYDLRMIDSRNWSVGYTTEHMWHEVGTLKKGL
jgi:hypothetical protein